MKKTLLIITSVLAVAVVGYFIVSKNKNSNTNSSTTNSAKPSTTYTMSQVASHNSESSCWMVINGNVYDVTSYIPEHPTITITDGCGIDATSMYEEIAKHQGRANSTLADYLIGTLSN